MPSGEVTVTVITVSPGSRSIELLPAPVDSTSITVTLALAWLAVTATVPKSSAVVRVYSVVLDANSGLRAPADTISSDKLASPLAELEPSEAPPQAVSPNNIVNTNNDVNNNFNPLAYEQWYLDSLEKFAELIVRECINIGDNYEDILGNEPECFNCRKVAYGIVDKIKQHFGVEE